MAARYMRAKEFAAHIGHSPSHITKLKQHGRLALTKDGRIKVRESLALIEATAGNRADVAARHAEARRAGNTDSEISSPAPEKKNAPEVQEAQEEITVKDALRIKALAESRRVAALADREEMERDRMAGDLIAREDVDAAMKFIGATVRGLLDVFPDQTAPLVVAARDLDEAHATLTESCRDVLVRLGEAIERQRAALDGGHA